MPTRPTVEVDWWLNYGARPRFSVSVAGRSATLTLAEVNILIESLIAARLASLAPDAVQVNAERAS